MPSELRKILFSTDEIWSACIAYCLHSRINLPKANIEDMVIGEDLKPAVTFHFSVSNPAERSKVALSREQVGAALIKYCKDQDIPLPKDGRKLLVADGKEAIAMMVNLNFLCQPTAKKASNAPDAGGSENPKAKPQVA